jgi:hypothetical protein
MNGRKLRNLLAGLSATNLLAASAALADSQHVRYAPARSGDLTPAATMDPRNVPDFSQAGGQPGASPTRVESSQPQGGTALQAGAESTTLPVETRLRLVLECPVDAKTSLPGDIFEGHVKDDLFLGTQLLLPKGALVRGRIADVTKPRMLSRAARIGLKLEQIVTPAGEVIPLDAGLEFKKGTTNVKGQLDPGTNFGTQVKNAVGTVTGAKSKGTERSALMAANIATLGAPAAAAMIGGSAIAIFRSGDNVSLQPGQELEILLTNDLGIQVN